MSVDRRITYFIQCDKCGVDYGWSEFDSTAQAVEVITGEGWESSCRGKNVQCPECIASQT